MRISFLIMLSSALLAGVAGAQTLPLAVAESAAVDTPGAVWVPAAPGNFGPANRPVDEPIDRIVIHDIEGTAQAGISIFQRPDAKVSAHYIVGAQGEVFQMVRERDVAWHAGNSPINHRSIGIETEGFAYRPGFYNLVELEAVARLVRAVTTRYGIVRDREHIIGHAEVPNPRDATRFGGVSGHTDPGPYWNWNTFMGLVRNDARVVSVEIPTSIRPNETLRAVVTLQNTGDDVWSANLAANPLTGLQASAPVVYLGTSNGAPSALSSLNGWISPTLAAGATTDTSPGATARFEFLLRGPRELGERNEKLRLSLQPTAVQGQTPIYFGESVALSLRVVPWIIDAAPTSNESAANGVAAGGVARWSAKLPVGGWWAVYLAPPKVKPRSRPFQYTLSGGEVEKMVSIEAKNGGKGAQFVGYYQLPEAGNRNQEFRATLNAAPDVSASNAGALRLVGPFPSPTR
jgi:hypothetical protein